MADLELNPTLGRDIRSGDSDGLGIATDEILLGAIESCEWDRVRTISKYLVSESERIETVLTTWLDGLNIVGRQRVDDWEEKCDALRDIIGVQPLGASTGDIAVEESKRLFRLSVDAEDADECRKRLSDLRLAQWNVHDDLTDWLWGLLSVFYDALGEDAMEGVFRESMEEWVAERYKVLPDLSHRERFELTIEGMRAHFSGPGSSGSIDVIEQDDCWVMEFDPCGSGGRMRRGASGRDQTPRTEPPFSFATVERAHDWTWQEEQVCLYCVHCAFVNEIFPIERFGMPLRITEYPKNPKDKCRWTVYKDAAAVPASAYERVGKNPDLPVHNRAEAVRNSTLSDFGDGPEDR